MRVDLARELGISFEPAILRRQKIHREMNARQVTTGNVELTRRTRASRDANRVELAAQFFDGDVHADVDSTLESHSFCLEL